MAKTLNTDMQLQAPYTGVVCFRPDECEAWLEGKKIATFNSKGAAEAGIQVEKRRRANKKSNS